MKALLRTTLEGDRTYQALMFVCPGCHAFRPDDDTGVHRLPVNSDWKTPSWTFDGNLDAPTLSPSILTIMGDTMRCHSFLRAGVFEFLTDSTHPFAGQHVPIPDLYDWITDLP